MPVQVEGELYYTIPKCLKSFELASDALALARKRHYSTGLRYRTRQVLFKREEVDAIRQFANRLVPIELGAGDAQLGLFRRGSQQEES